MYYYSYKSTGFNRKKQLPTCSHYSTPIDSEHAPEGGNWHFQYDMFDHYSNSAHEEQAQSPNPNAPKYFGNRNIAETSLNQLYSVERMKQ